MPVQKLLAKIHIAKRDLGLNEDVYRDALEGQTGKRSAAEMTNDQIAKCLRHFVSLGWIPKSKPKKYDNQKGDIYSASPQIKRKIEAMWHDYHHEWCKCGDEKGHGRRWLFSKFKISDVAFLDPRTAYEAVEGLKAMQGRHTPWNTGQDSTGQGRGAS